MKCKEGALILEVLLVMGLMVILLPALLTGLYAARTGKAQQMQRVQAVALLKETQEAMRNVRDQGWTLIETNGTYHPTINGSNWTLATGSATINGFTQSVVITDASRDANGAIVTSGGTVDPSTKKIVSTIAWGTPLATSVTATEYLTRHTSLSYSETTKAQFDLGTFSSTYTAQTYDGEVILGAGGGGGDWCIPSKSITQYDLPKSGVANAVTAIEGRIFSGTGDNASGVSFADVKLQISPYVDPPQVTSSKTFDGYKTNAVFGESNFAYLATDNNSKEVVMLDLNQYSDPPTNSKYKEIGSIDIPGSGNGDSIYVLNNKAYVTSGTKLYIYTLSADRTTATLQNATGYTLSGTSKKIMVGPTGQYAYVITNATSNQFEIINVSNAASPTRASRITVGTTAGVDLYVSSSETTAYVALGYTASGNNVYKIDISNKSAPVIGAGYSTSGMNPKALTVVTGNRAIVVGTGGTYQYQVINTNNMQICASSPYSGLQYPTGVNGIASILQGNGYAYSYIITGDAAAELKFILGGAGGQFVSSGTYESKPLYIGNSATAFNGFTATVSQPASTTLSMLVSVANASGGTCPTTSSSYTYLGQNGTATPFTVGSDPNTISGSIPLITSGNYVNPGKCFRYKATFNTSDSASTPVIYDVTVNYSP
jgi:type II secretory pathway pseudopilin PulG